MRAVDYDLAKAQERAAELSKIAEAKEFELKRTAESLDSAQMELARLKDENQRFVSDSLALQRQTERQAEDKAALLRQREIELAKGRDLSANFYDLEARYRVKEEQTHTLRKEIDAFRYSNSSMVEKNDEFQAELEALNQHVQLLEGQNRGLNRELE